MVVERRGRITSMTVFEAGVQEDGSGDEGGGGEVVEGKSSLSLGSCVLVLTLRV